MSQWDLAIAVGKNQSWVSLRESGTHNTTEMEAQAIASALGIHGPRFLLDWRQAVESEP